MGWGVKAGGVQKQPRILGTFTLPHPSPGEHRRGHLLHQPGVGGKTVLPGGGPIQGSPEGWGEGAGIRQGPLSFILAPDKEPPAPLVYPHHGPGLPAIAPVTGAALWLLPHPPTPLSPPPPPTPSPVLPPAGCREGAGSWPSFPFSAKTLPFVPGSDRPDNAGSRLP